MLWFLIGPALGGMIVHWQNDSELKVSGVQLVKVGSYASVNLKVKRNWVYIMREVAECRFNRTVTESGIRECLDRHPLEARC